MAAGLDRLKAAVEGSDVHIVDALWYGGEATYTQIERLVAEPSVQAADAIFAMGGGKVVDTCKMAPTIWASPSTRSPPSLRTAPR